MVYLEPDLLLIENNVNPKTQNRTGFWHGFKKFIRQVFAFNKEGIKGPP